MSDQPYIQNVGQQENCEIQERKVEHYTNRSITANTCAPWGWLVYHAEIILDAIWARGWLGDNVCGGRLGSFDLHKTFCAYGLVTTSRMVNIGRVILRPRHCQPHPND